MKEFCEVFMEAEAFRLCFKGWVKYVISDMVGEHFRKREPCAQRQEDGKVYNSVCPEPRILRW